MSLFDFLKGKTKCPECGADGALKTADGYKCPNPRCQWHDRSLTPGGGRQVMTPTGTAVEFRSAQSVPSGSVGITYRNFNGESKTFVAEVDSARRRKNHWSVKVQPKGVRIALSRERIQNLSEVEARLPHRVAAGQSLPTPRERQVLAYHKKYRTSSPLYEQIRAKYPDW